MQWGWFRCWTLSDASSRFNEPPDAEPHVRWCERATGVTPSPTRSSALSGSATTTRCTDAQKADTHKNQGGRLGSREGVAFRRDDAAVDYGEGVEGEVAARETREGHVELEGTFHRAVVGTDSIGTDARTGIGRHALGVDIDDSRAAADVVDRDDGVMVYLAKPAVMPAVIAAAMASGVEADVNKLPPRPVMLASNDVSLSNRIPTSLALVASSAALVLASVAPPGLLLNGASPKAVMKRLEPGRYPPPVAAALTPS